MRGGRRGAAAAHELAREGSTGVWAQGTGRVHLEHFCHDVDLGCVEVHWLVESLRVLQSQKGGIRCGEVAEGRQPRAGPRVKRGDKGRLDWV
eukprot:scaffold3454_cov68-Phaeocystis_antarctica.AAC.6